MPAAAQSPQPLVASPYSRVLIVDDHPLFRDALRTCLSHDAGFTVCGAAGSAVEARRLCAELRPELMLLDLGLPDGDGLALLEESRTWESPPKVLVITVRGEDDPVALEALRLGASGFVCKRAAGAEVLEAARQVRRGLTYLSPGLIEQLVRRK